MNPLRQHFTTFLDKVQQEAPAEASFALMLNAPPEIAGALNDVRRRYDPAFRAGIPPHITVKRPAPLGTMTKLDPLRDELRSVSALLPPIEVQLQGYGTFKSPGRNVVFLKVQDEAPFCRLHMRALEVLTGFFPVGLADQYEAEKYHPHLTIGNELSELDLAVLEHELSSGGYRLDFSFSIEQVALCVTHSGQPWQIIENFPFSASPGNSQPGPEIK